MRVRATKTGYYENERRRPGQIFTLHTIVGRGKDGKEISVSPEKQFSKNWMETIDIVPPPEQQNANPPSSKKRNSDLDVI